MFFLNPPPFFLIGRFQHVGSFRLRKKTDTSFQPRTENAGGISNIFGNFLGPEKVGFFWGLRFPNWTKKPKPLENLGKGLEPHTSSPQPCWGKLRSVQALYFRDMGWPLTHLGLVLAGGFLLRMLTQHIQARKVNKNNHEVLGVKRVVGWYSWMVKRWVMKFHFLDFFRKESEISTMTAHQQNQHKKLPWENFQHFQGV